MVSFECIRRFFSGLFYSDRVRRLDAVAGELNALERELARDYSKYAEIPPEEEAHFTALWNAIHDLQFRLEQNCHGMPEHSRHYLASKYDVRRPVRFDAEAMTRCPNGEMLPWGAARRKLAR